MGAHPSAGEGRQVGRIAALRMFTAGLVLGLGAFLGQRQHWGTSFEQTLTDNRLDDRGVLYWLFDSGGLFVFCGVALIVGLFRYFAARE
jgi:hypothetical protein